MICRCAAALVWIVPPALERIDGRKLRTGPSLLHLDKMNDGNLNESVGENAQAIDGAHHRNDLDRQSIMVLEPALPLDPRSVVSHASARRDPAPTVRPGLTRPSISMLVAGGGSLAQPFP